MMSHNGKTNTYTISKKDVRYVCNDEEEEDMSVSDLEKIDVRKSLTESFKEVESIKKGELPRRSYKEMIKQVRQQLNENK